MYCSLPSCFGNPRPTSLHPVGLYIFGQMPIENTKLKVIANITRRNGKVFDI
jgi:hypothetical protein